MLFFDIILGVILTWGLWKGLKNGLIVEIASILALTAGIFGAIHFSYIIGDYLCQYLQWNDNYINLAAFICTLILIIIVVWFAGKLLTKIANFTMLGLMNKIAGGLFGVLKSAIILGAILVFFERVNNAVCYIENETLQSSIFYDPVKEIGRFIFSIVLKE